jgi:hypothetical protein
MIPAQAYEGFALRQAFWTAWNMSFISMLSMELAENVVDISITGGQFAPAEPLFWLALGMSDHSFHCSCAWLMDGVATEHRPIVTGWLLSTTPVQLLPDQAPWPELPLT